MPARAKSETVQSMNCGAYRLLITSYIDGELSDNEIQMLKTHVQTCEDCMCYLQKQEALRAALHRYNLFQETPPVPADFAQRITSQLSNIATEPSQTLEARVRKTYRRFVLTLVENWIGSLKARPFAWITSAASFLIVLVGALLFQIAFHVSSPQLITMASREEIQERSVAFSEKQDTTEPQMMLTASRSSTSQKTQQPEVSAPEVRVISIEEGEELSEQVFDAEFRETSQDQIQEPIKVVEIAEEPFMQVASNGISPVDEYVYSHVLEAAQDQFVDDAVFVGYVQDISIE